MRDPDPRKVNEDIGAYRLAVSQLLEQISRRNERIRWLRSEQERLNQELMEKEKALHDLSVELGEREQAGQTLQARVSDLEQTVAHLKAAQERLQQRLRWKRYRVADRVIAIYWYVRHPKQLFRFVRERIWQLGRKWLPTPVKAWIKRVILRQSPPPWQTPRSLPSQRQISEPAELILQSQMPITPHYDVIVFPIIDWGFHFQRPQQIAKQFAKSGHRVFYLKTSFQRQKTLEDCRPTVQPVEMNIAEVQLPGSAELNVYRQKVDKLTLQRWLKAFDHLRRDYSIDEAVCLVQLPFWRSLAFQLRERFGWRVVYDCMDKHSGFSTNEPAMLQEEEALSRDSDLILVTSRKLFEEQQRYGSRCLLVPNACEFDHFSTSLGAVPSTLAAFAKPIIGYYGAISDWFDTELVAEMARLRPGWSFVLVGDTFGADLSPLKGLANVHLFGEQPYQALPAYLHAFDICLIPFKLTPLTEATNPVKFYEYVSAGKPVVAVPLPELVPYEAEGLVYLAKDPKEFVEKIEQALRENNAERVAARRRFAAQNTWEERFARIQAAIRQVYKRASIIVLTYNNLHLTRSCIESIFRNTLWPNYELIIVDNASMDGTREYLNELARKHENIKLISNDRNEGFARANNQGILAATGEYIVLLNNDTIVTRGWLGRLIRYLEKDPKIGMVGPVTNSAGNEAKIGVSYSSIEEMEVFAERWAREHEGQSFEIKTLALFCTVMRRRLFDEVGLLDERFEVGMFEDDDLALRVKQVGYRILCCEDVFVHHYHSATFKQFSQQEYLRLFEANRKRFEEKWGMRWEPHKYREEKHV